MKIRRVRPEDLDLYVQVRYELWPDHTMDELRTEAIDNLQGQETPAFFAVDKGGQVLGFIECSIHDSAPGCHTKKIGFVEGWYVKKERQGKGIGRALMEAAEDWARTHACTEMASDTTKDYPKSPAAHQALGFLESSKPMHYYKNIEKRTE